MDVFDLAAKVSLDTSSYNRGISAAKSAIVGLGNTIKSIAGVSAIAVSAASTAVGALAKQSLDAYGSYEQLVGGVETLFKSSAEKVQKYADQAYQTAGLSANEYMETVTSFSASLLQSLKGDTEKAADTADVAIRDMSDNANKMGTAMESIQNAYQGFAKQNYTMLDNLKLGYGGTKAEMERLLKDADELNAKHGKSTKYQIENYSDIIEAIHVIQTEMGITGTTAEEAAGTIQGSVGSMAAAWKNFVVELGKDSGDISGKFDILAKSVSGALDNMLPRFSVILDNIGVTVSKAAPVISAKLPELAKKILPKLVMSGVNLTVTVLKTIARYLPTLITEIRPELPKLWDRLKVTGSLLMENVIKPAWDFITVQLPQYINSTINKIDFKAVGETISTAIKVGLKGLADFISEIDWVQVGISIAHFINGIDFKGIAKALAKLFGEALKALPDLLTGILSELDFNNFTDGLALIFVPLMLGQIKDGLAKSKIWGDIGDVINEKMGGANGNGGLGASAGGKFLMALEAFWLGWQIGTEIYNHFEEEINGVLFPIFDKVKDAWNSIFNLDLEVQDNGDSFIVRKTVGADTTGFRDNTYSSEYNSLAQKWGAYDDDYFQKWYGISKEEYLRGAAEAKAKAKGRGMRTGMSGASLWGLNPFYEEHATGGVMVTNPVMTTSGHLFGEAGREVILPLDRNTGWMDELAKRLGGNSGVVVQNLNINMDGMKIASDYDTERFVEILSERLQALSVSQDRSVGGVGW